MFYNRSIIRFQHDMEQGKHSGVKEILKVFRNKRLITALFISIGYVFLVSYMFRNNTETEASTVSKSSDGHIDKKNNIKMVKNNRIDDIVRVEIAKDDNVLDSIERLLRFRLENTENLSDQDFKALDLKILQQIEITKKAKSQAIPKEVKENSRVPVANPGNADLEKQAHVKSMMQHAWKGYRDFAFGADELKPISKTSRNWLTGSGLAATLIDSLDTLKIMGMDAEFKEAVDFAVTKVDFDQNSMVSFFETTIRIVGGYLSAYHLDGEKDQRLLKKAVDVADRLLPAFETSFGLPRAQVNLHNGHTSMSWAGGRYLLAEIGSFQLEFHYLSHLTGDPKYRQKAENVIEKVAAMTTGIPGLYPAYIDESMSQSSDEYTMGGLADSFYEYLLKMWLYSGKTNQKYQKLYDSAVTASLQNLLGKNSEGEIYMGYRSSNYVNSNMEHLTCFAGGMLALGHYTKSSSDPKAMEAAQGITRTCYLMYQKQKWGLSPEKVRMSDFHATDSGSSYYIQRPEAIESLFYLWRLTKDQKYRDWGWEIVQSMEKNIKVEHGYSGINNINQDPISLNDNQESFFLAETLKYLYLLFSDDSVIPLDDYVFNTEAHPIPIIGK